MKRIFAAVKIEPQPELTAFLGKLRMYLADSDIKWVELKNLHLTLKFFGETSDDKIPLIAEVMKKVTCTPFVLVLGNLKIFGSRYQPRVLFLEAMNAEPFVDLRNQVDEQIKLLGYEPDRQNFVPHLTIGRIKKISDKKYFQQNISNFSDKTLQFQQVSAFYLIESTLHSSGPEYNVLASFALE